MDSESDENKSSSLVSPPGASFGRPPAPAVPPTPSYLLRVPTSLLHPLVRLFASSAACLRRRSSVRRLSPRGTILLGLNLNRSNFFRPLELPQTSESTFPHLEWVSASQ